MTDTRKRARPTKSVPKVRARKRPKAKPVTADPRMPATWADAAPIVCGAANKKYKPYQRKMGAADEDNPNLMGRVSRSGGGTKFTAWRWFEGRYHWLCEKGTYHEAHRALSDAFGGW